MMVGEPADVGGGEGAERRRGGVWRMLAIAALAIIIILIFLLLWNPFGGARRAQDAGRRPGLVGSISDLPPSEDYVAFWLRPGQDVDAVLARHGLGAEAMLFADAEDGYYVISVGEADPSVVASALKSDPALYDAGRVYEGDDTTEP